MQGRIQLALLLVGRTVGQYVLLVEEAGICRMATPCALPMDDDLYRTVAEFIALGRRCCPFVAFVLEVEPEGGSLWLRLTGGEGVTDILRAELGISAVPS